eukprot:1179936-Prymnesium_polylepis.2
MIRPSERRGPRRAIWHRHVKLNKLCTHDDGLRSVEAGAQWEALPQPAGIEPWRRGGGGRAR